MKLVVNSCFILVLLFIRCESVDYECYNCIDCDTVDKGTKTCDTGKACLKKVMNPQATYYDVNTSTWKQFGRTTMHRTCFEYNKTSQNKICEDEKAKGLAEECLDCYTKLCNGAPTIQTHVFLLITISGFTAVLVNQLLNYFSFK